LFKFPEGDPFFTSRYVTKQATKTIKGDDRTHKFVFNDDGFRGQAMDSMIANGCIVSGSTIERSLLFLKVHVLERGLIQDSVILPKVRIGRRVRLKRVVVDKLCMLPDDFSAGFDPEQDRRNFHVTDNGITLITPEMLGQHVHQTR
jgi:glucose-1-phosphate adenylyltransferase